MKTILTNTLKTTALTMLGAVLLTGCGGSGNGNGNFPDDFNTRTDAQKVAYVMEATSPDSVARFICYAALGQVDGVKVDSVNQAVMYAYEHYQGDDVEAFSREFDRVQDNLPLAAKMQLLKMAGTQDSLGLGLDLGLHYIDRIRDSKLSVADVKAEISAFHKACANDTATYVRFVKGVKAALKEDNGRSLSPQIQNEIISLQEEF